MNEPGRATPRGRGRRAWLWLHRWLGLGLGLWFVTLGLSGSVLVFYRGLDEWLDPRLAPRPAATAVPPIEAVYQALRAAHPQRGSGWRIELPTEPGEAITARYLKPAETAGQGFAPLLSTVDPATLQVVANRFWGQHFSTWVYDLHYSLLLGDVGTQLVGWSGVLLLLSLLSGAWLWWPRPGHWRSALQLKRPASPTRRVYDLHKLGGVWGGLLLAVMAVTGAVLGLPDLVRPLVASVSPLMPMSMPMPQPAPGAAAGPRLPVDAVLQQAVARFPGAQARWLDTPSAPGAPYRLRLRQPGEPGDRFPDTVLWLDAATGAELARRDPRQFGAGDQFLQWMHPLHSGQAFGLAGRLLVCASGLLPLLLAVTGFLRWRTKRRARAWHLARGPA